VPVDPGTGLVDPDDIRRAIRPDTRLIAITHASNVTGTVQPIREIGRIARERGVPFVVDAAQSAGHVSIDVREDGIDLLAAPGHKALLGPLVHRSEISELKGEFLAPYEVTRVEVPLTDEEQRTHDEARARYLGFVRSHGIHFGSPGGWARFLAESQRSDEGRAAYRAYREQRRIALTSRAKVDVLWRILREHRDERVIVFTEDNDTVYTLARWLLLPALTHHTPVPERKALLAAFAAGELPALLTSRVLNEGVDVPDASVGVILSGSGSVREHVQRLGRLLRKRPGKRARLYELCSRGTAEANISERRRQHGAYREGEGC